MTHDEELIEKAATEHYALKGHRKNEYDAFKEAIYWRDQNPKPVEGRTDSERLEWMIKRTGWYRHTDHDQENTYIQIKMLPGANLSCRIMIISAIDAAMDQETKRGDANE